MERKVYPVWDNENKKINWKNVFRTDWKTILFIAWILFMAFAYKNDMAVCQEVIDNPKGFCNEYCITKQQNIIYTNSDGVNSDGQTLGEQINRFD